MNILVSQCLLGINCKYNGGNNLSEEVLSLKDRHTLIPVCPEQLGGLPTPRVPSERGSLGKVYSKNDTDVTEGFFRGAEEALKLAKLFNCEYAVLKSNSPSCGSSTIYDGSFSGQLIEGDGVTAEILKKNGIKIISEKDLENLKRL